MRASVPPRFRLDDRQCLSDFKKMMCARVFCVDNGKCSIFFWFTFAIDFVFTNNLALRSILPVLGNFALFVIHRYSSSMNPISRPDDSATYVNGLPYKKPCSSLQKRPLTAPAVLACWKTWA